MSPRPDGLHADAQAGGGTASEVTRLREQVASLQAELRLSGTSRKEGRATAAEHVATADRPRPSTTGTEGKSGQFDGQLRGLQLEMDSHKLRLELAAARSSLEAETRKRVRQEKIVAKLMKELREAKLLAGAREATLKSVATMHAELSTHVERGVAEVAAMHGTVKKGVEQAAEQLAMAASSDVAQVAQRVPEMEEAAGEQARRISALEQALEEANDAIENQRQDLKRKEDLLTSFSRHLPTAHLEGVQPPPEPCTTVGRSPESSRLAHLTQYTGLIEAELMGLLDERASSQQLIDELVYRAETAERERDSLTAAPDSTNACGSSTPFACTDVPDDGDADSGGEATGPSDEGFTVVASRRRGPSSTTEAEARAAAEAEADKLMAGDLCAPNPYGFLLDDQVPSSPNCMGEALCGERVLDTGSAALRVRLAMQADVSRLHETLGEEVRKRTRLEKIVSKLMKELKASKLGGLQPASTRHDQLRQLERELLKQLGHTGNKIDSLQAHQSPARSAPPPPRCPPAPAREIWLANPAHGATLPHSLREG